MGVVTDLPVHRVKDSLLVVAAFPHHFGKEMSISLPLTNPIRVPRVSLLSFPWGGKGRRETVFTTELVSNLHVLSPNNSRFYASGIHHRKMKKITDDGISKTLKPNISGHRCFELSLICVEFRVLTLDARHKAVMH